MANNYDNIPAEIRIKPNWVGFKIMQKADGIGWSKLPINIKTGKAASCSDASTWTDFASAVSAVKSRRYGISDIGYAFDGDGIIGIDIDHCARKDGELNAMAKDILSTVSSYTEYSVSGGGIHIIARSSEQFESGKHGDFEIYRTGRFFVFTGTLLGDNLAEILDCTEEIKKIYMKYMPHKSVKKTNALGREGTALSAVEQQQTAHLTALNAPLSGVRLPDEQILEIAMAARNGARFTELWSGNASAYPSYSEADLALCNMLAFYTAKDEIAMDRLFRTSGLYTAEGRAKKWNERHGGETYGEITIRKAINNCREVYKPKAPKLKNTGVGGKQKRALTGESYITEIESAYHLVQTDGKSKRLTNFVMQLNRKLVTDEESIYSVSLVGSDGRKAGIQLKTSDLVSAQGLKKKLNERDIGWSLLASDRELELIKEYLNAQPCPQTVGFKGIGIHKLPFENNSNRWVYVGERATIDSNDSTVTGAESIASENPIHSAIESADEISRYELLQAGHALLGYNELPKTVSVLCFMAAALAKPKLAERGIKFPHLVIVGESGAGKSFTTEKVIQPFFALKSVVGASKITSYSFLASAGASNNIPLIIDEYKPSTLRDNIVDNIHNGLRDLYDGHDGERGRADMTVKKYKLTIPLVLSGEESPAEPALKERSIELLYSKTDIVDKFEAGAIIENRGMQESIRQLGKAVLLTTLSENSGTLRNLYDDYKNMSEEKLPPRVRNNIAVLCVGGYLLEQTAKRYGADFITAFGIEQSEILKLVTEAVKKYTLGGGSYNKSVVDKAFEVFDRMTEILKNEVHYKRVDNAVAFAVAFDIKRIYDKFTKYHRDCNQKGEVLDFNMFRNQLEKKDYFIKRNYSVQLREDVDGAGKFHTVKCYLLNAKKLAVSADISNILERCAIVFPDTPKFEQVALDEILSF